MEEFNYYSDVAQAAHWIGWFLKKYARMHVSQTKEKFGTARVYCMFGWSQLHTITHPGYVYSQYPKWLWEFDIDYLSWLFYKLDFIVVPFHTFMYKLAYKLAIKKYPYIKEEILAGADYRELLEYL